MLTTGHWGPVPPGTNTEKDNIMRTTLHRLIRARRAASAARRTFGGRFPSRRTFGLRSPSRRTFGGRYPSRRTFGGRIPSRRTFGYRSPSRRTFGFRGI